MTMKNTKNTKTMKPTRSAGELAFIELARLQDTYDDPVLLTATGASRFVGCSPGTIRAAVRRGELKAVRALIGAQETLLLLQTDVLEFVAPPSGARPKSLEGKP